MASRTDPGAAFTESSTRPRTGSARACRRRQCNLPHDRLADSGKPFAVFAVGPNPISVPDQHRLGVRSGDGGLDQRILSERILKSPRHVTRAPRGAGPSGRCPGNLRIAQSVARVPRRSRDRRRGVGRHPNGDRDARRDRGFLIDLRQWLDSRWRDGDHRRRLGRGRRPSDQAHLHRDGLGGSGRRHQRRDQRQNGYQVTDNAERRTDKVTFPVLRSPAHRSSRPTRIPRLHNDHTLAS